jgi:malate synthase
MTLRGALRPEDEEVLTPEALTFVRRLAQRFEPDRRALLEARERRQQALRSGQFPDFLPETADVRQSEWKVAEAPKDLGDRRVEITGPTERKMMINALNSGAKVFMADLEDSTAPTWRNVLDGQRNLMEAARRTLRLDTPSKVYALGSETATLVVRPRGWHLVEKNLLIDGQPISASLFDFGLYFFHNAPELIRRGTGPYFYLPKLESHLEARLWNEVFNAAQDELGIPRGTIRATVLIETILAAFEMEEILYELRDHAAGLNAGRWDYIFSLIKKFSHRPDFVLPDRAQVTMTVPFMAAYADLLVKTCHKRGAHAIGGMAAFIPSRKDAEVNEVAMAKVREDKVREAKAGFDGTWVAHPDLVPVAMREFDAVLGKNPHQKQVLREKVRVTGRQLLDLAVEDARVTEAGLRNNLSVALQYLSAWLGGTGAVAIFNLMEDAATAEIARAQLWQWIRHGIRLKDGRQVTPDLYRILRDEELSKLPEAPHLQEAAALLDHLVGSERFIDFLTIPAYDALKG